MNNIKGFICLLFACMVSNAYTQEGEVYIEQLRKELFPIYNSNDYVKDSVSLKGKIYYYQRIKFESLPDDREIGSIMYYLKNCEFIDLYDDIVALRDEFIDTLNHRYIAEVADTVIDFGGYPKAYVLRPLNFLIDYLNVCKDNETTTEEKVLQYLDKLPNITMAEGSFLSNYMDDFPHLYLNKLDASKDLSVKIDIIRYLGRSMNDQVQDELIKRLDSFKEDRINLYLLTLNSLSYRCDRKIIADLVLDEIEENKDKYYVVDLLSCYGRIDDTLKPEENIQHIKDLGSYFIKNRNIDAINGIRSILSGPNTKLALVEYFVELYENNIMKEEMLNRLENLKIYSDDPQIRKYIKEHLE